MSWRFSIPAIVVLVAVATAAFCLGRSLSRNESLPDEKSSVASPTNQEEESNRIGVSITLAGLQDGVTISSGSPTLAAHVAERISSAAPDPRLAPRYVIIGELTVTHSGRTETVVLFQPFGHFKRQESYYIGDFASWKHG